MKIVIDMDEQMYKYICGHYTVIDGQFLGKGNTAEQILGTVADDQILGIVTGENKGND